MPLWWMLFDIRILFLYVIYIYMILPDKRAGAIWLFFIVRNTPDIQSVKSCDLTKYNSVLSEYYIFITYNYSY